MRRDWTEEVADLAPLPEMSWEEFEKRLVPVSWDDVDAAAGRLFRVARRFSRRYRDSRERENLVGVAFCIGFMARKDRGIIDANGNVRIVTLTTIKQISEWTDLAEGSVQKYVRAMLEEEKFPLTRIVRGNHDVAGKPRPSVFAVSDIALSVAESNEILADGKDSRNAHRTDFGTVRMGCGRSRRLGRNVENSRTGGELNTKTRTLTTTARNDYIDGSFSLKSLKPSSRPSQEHKSEQRRGGERPWEAAGVTQECWEAAMAVDGAMTCHTKRSRRAELAQAVSAFVEAHPGISLRDVVTLARGYSGTALFGTVWLDSDADGMAEDLLQGRRDEERELERRDMSRLSLPELAHVMAQGARIGRYGSFGGGWYASPDNPLWDRGAIDFASDAEVRGLTDEEVRALLEERILEELAPRTQARTPRRPPLAAVAAPAPEPSETPAEVPAEMEPMRPSGAGDGGAPTVTGRAEADTCEARHADERGPMRARRCPRRRSARGRAGRDRQGRLHRRRGRQAHRRHATAQERRPRPRRRDRAVPADPPRVVGAREARDEGRPPRQAAARARASGADEAPACGRGRARGGGGPCALRASPRGGTGARRLACRGHPEGGRGG